MNRWKKFGIVAAKHAVNALLTNAGLWATFPKEFNFHHVLAFFEAAAIVVTSRELMVWVPKLVVWSQTNENDYVDFGGQGKNEGRNEKL